MLLRPAQVGPVDRIPSCAALATDLPDRFRGAWGCRPGDGRPTGAEDRRGPTPGAVGAFAPVRAARRPLLFPCDLRLPDRWCADGLCDAGAERTHQRTRRRTAGGVAGQGRHCSRRDALAPVSDSSAGCSTQPRPFTNCWRCSKRFVRAATASASWPCSSWINDGRLPRQQLPQPPGDLGSELCGFGSRYSPDSQARTCCLNPSKMASVILWGNPADCSRVICA